MKEKWKVIANILGFVFLLGGLLLYGLCSKGFIPWDGYEPAVMVTTMVGTVLIIIGFFQTDQ